MAPAQSPGQSGPSKKLPSLFYLVAVIAVIVIGLKLFADHFPGLLSPKDSSQRAGPLSVTAQSPAEPVPAPADAPTAPIMKAVATPNGVLSVEVSSSELARERGLSGRTSIAADSGMLFVFPEDGIYGFWMKDMKLPLDMVWISSDKAVTGVLSDVPADSYPKIFYPPGPIRYVLELPVSSAAEHRIVTGSRLSF